MKSSAILLTTCLSFVSQLCALDWAQFRGPNGNGTVEDPTFPAISGSASTVWSQELPGRGLSSPIIIGHRIFVTCSSGPRQDRLHVLCLNVEDGSKRWERQFYAMGRTTCHEKTCVAAPTPVSDGLFVFAIFSSNDVVCLDLDGNLVWLRGLMRDYPSASNSLGMSSSLLVADGVVLAQVENDTESFSVGLDARTGQNRWKLDRPKAANWTSPLLLPGVGNHFSFGIQSSAGFVAVESTTGKILWNYTNGASTVASSARYGNLVLTPSNGMTALEPDGEGKSAKQLWRAGQIRVETASPLVLGDRVYTLNAAGVLSANDLVEGKRLWQLRLAGSHSASPVAVGSRIYCVNEEGLLQIIDPTQPGGQIVDQVELNETILSTPSIAQGSIFVRSDAHIWRLGKAQAKIP